MIRCEALPRTGVKAAEARAAKEGDFVKTLYLVRRWAPRRPSHRVLQDARFKPANDIFDITTVIGGSARRAYDCGTMLHPPLHFPSTNRLLNGAGPESDRSPLNFHLFNGARVRLGPREPLARPREESGLFQRAQRLMPILASGEKCQPVRSKRSFLMRPVETTRAAILPALSRSRWASCVALIQPPGETISTVSPSMPFTTQGSLLDTSGP
jgi:hypothetical protein